MEMTLCDHCPTLLGLWMVLGAIAVVGAAAAWWRPWTTWLGAMILYYAVHAHVGIILSGGIPDGYVASLALGTLVCVLLPALALVVRASRRKALASASPSTGV